MKYNRCQTITPFGESKINQIKQAVQNRSTNVDEGFHQRNHIGAETANGTKPASVQYKKTLCVYLDLLVKKDAQWIGCDWLQ